LIPRIIHYVWVGTSPKPNLVNRCIASWRMHCSDYEIVEWGNRELECVDNAYVREAASVGKWAFVSDYIRLIALFEQGGFYFDADLEITDCIDRFRSHNFVTGFERSAGSRRVRPITAFMGSVPGNPIVERLLSEYDELNFLIDGVPDMTSNTDRITRIFRREFGLSKRKCGDGSRVVHLRGGNNSAIYPSFYFCTPVSCEKNYSIHHFDGSWVEPGKRKVLTSVGSWQLLKFSFSLDEDAAPSLRSNEKLIWTFSIRGAKTRVLAIVKKQM